MNGGIAPTGVLTREHGLVALIDRQLDNPEYNPLLQHPRTRSLPDMLRRHGLLQVVVFLKSKDKGNETNGTRPDTTGAAEKDERDVLLLRLLETALTDELAQMPKTGTGEPRSLRAGDLATLGEMAPAEYLFLNESAIGAATWIQRLAAAREVLEKVRGIPGEAT